MCRLSSRCFSSYFPSPLHIPTIPLQTTTKTAHNSGWFEFCHQMSPHIAPKFFIRFDVYYRQQQSIGLKIDDGRARTQILNKLFDLFTPQFDKFKYLLTMSYQLYRNTTLGNTLQESLDELIQVCSYVLRSTVSNTMETYPCCFHGAKFFNAYFILWLWFSSCFFRSYSSAKLHHNWRWRCYCNSTNPSTPLSIRRSRHVLHSKRPNWIPIDSATMSGRWC